MLQAAVERQQARVRQPERQNQVPNHDGEVQSKFRSIIKTELSKDLTILRVEKPKLFLLL